MNERAVLWVDEQDNPIKVVSYARAHAEHLLHRVAVVYLISPEGRICAQHRKDGRLDHSVAGHVEIDETYLETAIRELLEETGIAAQPTQLKLLGRTQSRNGNPGVTTGHMMTVFCLVIPETTRLTIDTNESLRMEWMNPGEIEQMFAKHPDMQGINAGFPVTFPLAKAYLDQIRSSE